MVKRSRIITQQPKFVENSNIINLAPATVEHLNTSHKLSKIIRQAKKVSPKSWFYIVKQHNFI